MFKYCIYVSSFLFWSTAEAEWIEMPQFSDDTKIYRIPSGKYDQFHKFLRNDGQKQFSYRNVSETNTDQIHDFPKGYFTITDENLNLQMTHPTTPFTPTISTTQAVKVNYSKSTFAEDFNKTNTTEIPKISESEAPDVDDEDTEQVGKPESDFVFEDYVQDEKHENESIKGSNKDFLVYLPVDVLKNVHRILKSQPMTTEGKIYFLKSFEKTLMNEIESRLGVTLAPARKTRGVHDHHYDHGYDDYEDHGLGFPSLEGALMAISFLTFAVYLVRLVMVMNVAFLWQEMYQKLLFRNPNTANNNNTNGTPTVFLGRRKRSAFQFDEDTARILSGVENFIRNYK